MKKATVAVNGCNVIGKGVAERIDPIALDRKSTA